MAQMSSLVYFFREALVGFKRNLSTALGSIITIFLSLLIIGIFLIGGIMIENVVKSFENKVSITAYIGDGSSQEDIDALKNDISKMNNVKSVGFTTKDQALEKFRSSHASNKEMVEQLDGQNPLPASIDIELNNPQDVGKVADQISNNETFKKICDNPSTPSESLKYGQKDVQKMFTMFNTIRIVGIALIALLIFIAMIFINNTIRLAILARRKEIAIMRLVGASNGFIRGPFFMESCLHSLIGALGAIVGLELIRNLAIPALSNSLAWLEFDVSVGAFLAIYLVLIIAGLIIGIIGSALAMRRYLTV